MKLKELVVKFKETHAEFLKCPEMILSGRRSAKAEQLSKEYFALEKQLYEIGLSLKEDSTDNFEQSVRSWAYWKNTAQGNVAIMSNKPSENQIDQCASVMNSLYKALDQMFALV